MQITKNKKIYISHFLGLFNYQKEMVPTGLQPYIKF